MYKIDFDKPCHVHFIGIGGISMSGLAQVLLGRGFTVSGSDSRENELCKALSAEGAIIHYPQSATNITDDIDLVVYTAAIHPDNPEYMACEEKNLNMLSRAQFLGQLMANYTRSIAVSGTHGKTTTTSMLAHILMAADTDPTISVGGILKSINGNVRVGASDIFLTEACEYTNSFLEFNPKYSVILNVEAEHLDFFKDEADVRESFKKFAGNTLENGLVVINNEIKNYSELVDALPADRRVLVYGFDEACDIYPANLTYDELGCGHFSLIYKGENIIDIDMTVPGTHNVSNALSAAAIAIDMEVEAAAIARGLHEFGGADRRFEFKGKLGGITVIDDYAHHPTEIRATLETAKKYPHDRIVVAFQPHTYSRTVAFFQEFLDALSLADVVVLADIYAAREVNESGISSKKLCSSLNANGIESYYIPTYTDSTCLKHDFDALEKFLLKKCIDGDLLITMGAGMLNEVSNNLVGR